jgi:hypothetical protein
LGIGVSVIKRVGGHFTSGERMRRTSIVAAVVIVCLIAGALIAFSAVQFAPVQSAQAGQTGCAVLQIITQPLPENSPNAAQVEFILFQGFPTRAMLYPQGSDMGIFLFRYDEAEASDYFPAMQQRIHAVEPGTYTAVFAGISGSLTQDVSVEQGQSVVMAVECM